MNLKLKELLDIPGCPMEFHGNQKRLESKPDGLSIDSRTLRPGEVFFAIRGEHQDGHAFVEAAIGKGALAVVVERRWWKKNAPALQAHACFVVRDTLRALQEIAAHYRRKFTLPVVGLTGTNGKTTTKELVAAVLARLGDVCKTEGNLNNHLGVPLTLARLQKSHRALVVEMGTNHFGEIARLCEIAAPDSGLITNIGHGHTEFFENIDGVARAKMELFQFLADTGGTAFVNADDPVLNNHLPRLSKKITYGFQSEADVRGAFLGLDAAGRPSIEVNGQELKINLVGAHNCSNALAAVAVGLEFGVTLSQMRDALLEVRLPGKRMEVIRARTCTILNDTYNANPESTIAALETLCTMPCDGKRVAVLGDMLELGSRAPDLHANVGEHAAKLGVQLLYGFGPLSQHTVKAAGRAAAGIEARHFKDKAKLIHALKDAIGKDDVVLVKGSRGMKMEDVVEALQ